MVEVCSQLEYYASVVTMQVPSYITVPTYLGLLRKAYTFTENCCFLKVCDVLLNHSRIVILRLFSELVFC